MIGKERKGKEKEKEKELSSILWFAQFGDVFLACMSLIVMSLFVNGINFINISQLKEL